jgi:hypothetical protein
MTDLVRHPDDRAGRDGADHAARGLNLYVVQGARKSGRLSEVMVGCIPYALIMLLMAFALIAAARAYVWPAGRRACPLDRAFLRDCSGHWRHSPGRQVQDVFAGSRAQSNNCLRLCHLCPANCGIADCQKLGFRM